ncbi:MULTISPECIES: histidinol-phosphatase HisJ family protein [Clostridium]|uniref:Histidinol-phosphatase n=1 Tax=Clostridium cibarium TaxID=2762247 RepID=A0ABR8PTL4_9CLOT|nr:MULTISPECIES: histidinol-phosphatase HisJ family protein [Clostridium]MBD7911483.1 histidinol-phosphatase HisJ family protein [Clostridium cibarium]
MYNDYHMHSYFSADSITPMESMIVKSIDLGLNEICFTDHVDYDIIGNPNVFIDYDKYFEELCFYKEKYRKNISIKKGLEIGLQPHILHRCSKEIQSHDFDFIIASIHTLERLELYTCDYHKGKTQEEVYDKYYSTLFNIIKNYKDYSVLGHLDLIKRYGDYPTILDDSIFSDYFKSILKQVIEDGKGIEVNTSCFRYGLPDLTPSTYILKLYKELGGEILTVGSDSHVTKDIATKFQQVHNYLKELGFKYVCEFTKMEPKFTKIY